MSVKSRTLHHTLICFLILTITINALLRRSSTTAAVSCSRVASVFSSSPNRCAFTTSVSAASIRTTRLPNAQNLDNLLARRRLLQTVSAATITTTTTPTPSSTVQTTPTTLILDTPSQQVTPQRETKQGAEADAQISPPTVTEMTVTQASAPAQDAVATTSSQAGGDKKPWARLSMLVSPTHYELHLQPDLAQHTFKGQVHITLSLEKETNEITLNAKELTILKAQVKQGDKTVVATVVDNQKEEETITLKLASSLTAGLNSAVLTIEYTGILNDKMQGFYRSSYVSAQGETKYLATTQFESTDCRQAVPSWDEPARKATFTVHLTTPKELTALSNMPIAKSEDVGNGLMSHEFESTPVMSTYLLAFIVGEFDFLETEAAGVTIRCYTLPVSGFKLLCQLCTLLAAHAL